MSALYNDVNIQEYKSFAIHAVIIKISMTEYGRLINHSSHRLL